MSNFDPEQFRIKTQEDIADFWGIDNSNDVLIEAWNRLTRNE